MDIINKRRSIRSFIDAAVAEEKITQLLRAGMQAPSAGNQRPWEFIVVREEETRKRLSEMSPYSKSIAQAPVALVLLGNGERMRFPENWQQDMGACAQNILLEAVAQDLGAVWLGVAPLRDREDHVRRVFRLPDHLSPYSIIAVGNPAGGQENKFVDRFDENRIHYETM